MIQNNSNTSLVVRDGEIVRQTVLVQTSKVDNKWQKEVKQQTPPHLLHQSIGATLNHIMTKSQEA